MVVKIGTKKKVPMGLTKLLKSIKLLYVADLIKVTTVIASIMAL
jgi:hypothetical protein